MEQYVDRSAILVKNPDDKSTDFEFWQTKSYKERLQALEMLRKQYITWKYGIEQGFQRVYRIVEQV